MDLNQFVTSLLAIAIGGGVLVYAGISISRGSKRKAWTHTMGEVIASEIRKDDQHDGTGTHYFPMVHYRYSVNLVEYESDVISRSEAPFAIGSDKYAKAMINKYQQNKKVNVYYDPDNPQEAALEINTSTGGIFLMIILGVSSLLCGLLLLLGALVQAGLIKNFTF